MGLLKARVGSVGSLSRGFSKVTGAAEEDLIVRAIEELCGSLLGLGNSTLVKLQTQIAT